MEVPRTYLLVVLTIEMFSKIIGQIFLAWVPFHVEVLHFALVCYPEESHLHGTGALLFHTVVGDASGSDIVEVHRGWRLGMAKFFED